MGNAKKILMIIKKSKIILAKIKCQDKLKKSIKYIIHNTLYKVYYNIRNREKKEDIQIWHL